MGVYYASDTLAITPKDSGLTVMNYNGEEVWLSGAKVNLKVLFTSFACRIYPTTLYRGDHGVLGSWWHGSPIKVEEYLEDGLKRPRGLTDYRPANQSSPGSSSSIPKRCSLTAVWCREPNRNVVSCLLQVVRLTSRFRRATSVKGT